MEESTFASSCCSAFAHIPMKKTKKQEIIRTPEKPEGSLPFQHFSFPIPPSPHLPPAAINPSNSTPSLPHPINTHNPNPPLNPRRDPPSPQNAKLLTPDLVRTHGRMALQPRQPPPLAHNFPRQNQFPLGFRGRRARNGGQVGARGGVVVFGVGGAFYFGRVGGGDACVLRLGCEGF